MATYRRRAKLTSRCAERIFDGRFQIGSGAFEAEYPRYGDHHLAVRKSAVFALRDFGGSANFERRKHIGLLQCRGSRISIADRRMGRLTMRHREPVPLDELARRLESLKGPDRDGTDQRPGACLPEQSRDST